MLFFYLMLLLLLLLYCCSCLIVFVLLSFLSQEVVLRKNVDGGKYNHNFSIVNMKNHRLVTVFITFGERTL